MNEEISVLQAIYSQPNEFFYDDQLETVRYNGQDYSVTIYLRTKSVMIDSSKLSAKDLKELRAQGSLTTTIYDLLNNLQIFYENLLNQRQQRENVDIDERKSAIYLFQIDHMRSPTIYMKHLKQWTNECQITGRVFVVGSREIYLLIEGDFENLKKFLVKLKSETVDVDHRGRPCKERLLSQLMFSTDHQAKFENFEKIDFLNRNDLKNYLRKFQFEHLFLSFGLSIDSD